MKTLFAVIFTAVVGTSFAAFAADADYSRLKKDVNVMTQILKSAFSSEQGCRRCRIRVDGTYLAEQGFLFTVHEVDGLYAVEMGDGNSYSYFFSDEGMATLEAVPDMVTRIVTNVTAAIPDVEVHDVADVHHIIENVDRATRQAVREIRRDRREIQMEMREQEIELIHLDADERAEREQELARLEAKLAEVESREAEVQAELAQKREALRQEMEEKRQLREREIAAQREKIEGRVLQAFCDYGSTLRSLPSREKVTVVFENEHRHGEGDEDTVYVFDRDDVVDCDRNKDRLVAEALKYQF